MARPQQSCAYFYAVSFCDLYIKSHLHAWSGFQILDFANDILSSPDTFGRTEQKVVWFFLS